MPNQNPLEIQKSAKVTTTAISNLLVAVGKEKQMDITNASPDNFAAQFKESYPFHFAIRDLYARFRENPGFSKRVA